MPSTSDVMAARRVARGMMDRPKGREFEFSGLGGALRGLNTLRALPAMSSILRSSQAAQPWGNRFGISPVNEWARRRGVESNELKYHNFMTRRPDTFTPYFTGAPPKVPMYGSSGGMGAPMPKMSLFMTFMNLLGGTTGRVSSAYRG